MDNGDIEVICDKDKYLARSVILSPGSETLCADWALSVTQFSFSDERYASSCVAMPVPVTESDLVLWL